MFFCIVLKTNSRRKKESSNLCHIWLLYYIIAVLTVSRGARLSSSHYPSSPRASIIQEEQILNLTPIGPVRVFKIHPSMNNWGCRFNMWSVDHTERQVELICRAGRRPGHQRYIVISGKTDLIAEHQIKCSNIYILLRLHIIKHKKKDRWHIKIK